MATETGRQTRRAASTGAGSPAGPGGDPGGPRAAYLAPDVPELVELLGAAEDALLVLAGTPGPAAEAGPTGGLGEPDSWWTWIGLAALGAAGCAVPPGPGPSRTPEDDRDGLVALRRLRAALAPALHRDDGEARPHWRRPGGRRVVAFRVVALDHGTHDDLTAAARRLRDHPRTAAAASGERDALDCLLAVLVPVDDPDAALLAAAAAAGSAGEVVLDERTHRAHRRVGARLLGALRRVCDPEAAGGPTTAPRDREDDR